MTDRYGAFIVVLEQNLREDDAEPVIAAIEQLRGVLSVTPHVVSIEAQIAEGRVRDELARKLYQALKEP